MASVVGVHGIYPALVLNCLVIIATWLNVTLISEYVVNLNLYFYFSVCFCAVMTLLIAGVCVGLWVECRVLRGL